MPTYEYRCPAGHDFEHFVQRISEATATMPCPTCGAAAVRRISAGGGLVFKGSGFYITDYGKDGKKDQRAKPSTSSPTKAAEPAKGSGADSAAKPADAKPAPAPPPSTGSSGK